MKAHYVISAIFCSFLTGCQSLPATQSDFKLTSSDIADHEPLMMKQVANTFGCDGGNQSPSLSWSNAPKGTKSFAISMYDPDAPTGSGFWHWLVVNIPSQQRSFDGNSGLTLMNDAGIEGYIGACPPQGQRHRYLITLYALDTDKLTVNSKTPNAVARFMLNQHVIAKTTIMTIYAR